MGQYKKKPVEIEAFQYGVDSRPDWFCDKVTSNDIITHWGTDLRQPEDYYCEIKTLEGVMRGDCYDYIIKGVKGEIYPCKPDIFKLTYDKLDEGFICKKLILDRVLILQDSAQEKVGTIFLGENEKKKPLAGIVKMVGPGALDNEGKNLPMSSQIGDHVIYPEFVGNNVVIDGIDYVILRENELLLIL